ncbi:hypothetical protein QD460_09565 [Rhizobium jaguaris]|uniref:COG4223 family protein n=1 Tax=Rhizobium jaguaris TaxID=1312183 RepID=UPI0039BFD46C
MVSGNPPNHSKPNDEPITIDLEAEETTRAAASKEMTERNHSEPGNSPPADEAEVPLEAEKERAKEDIDQPVADAAADEPKAAAEREPEPSRAEQTSVSPRQQGTTSGLIAAGIVGGLISLICVGAIQYAGLLPGGRAAKDNAANIAALTAEIDGLKRTVSNLAAAPAATPDAALTARVAALEAAATNNTAAAGGSSSTGSADTDQKLAALSAEVEQLKASLAQAAQSQASSDADVSKRLDDAEKKLNAPSQESAVARAIAAAALKAAIDRGGPFQPELDTFANVAPNDPAVADLKAFAQTGIPSRADLIRRVPDVATAIVGSAQQDDPNQSWSDRLLASAKSLVQVRPVGNVSGDSVAAIAARFEDKVKNGDLPGAVTEWNSLPDAAKSASAAFKQSLEARIRVEDLVGEALSKAIADTGKQS